MKFNNEAHFISKPILGGAELIALNLAKESGSVVISIFRLTKIEISGYKIYGLFFFFKNILYFKKIFSHTPSTYLFNSLLGFFLRNKNIFVLHSRLNLIGKYLKLLKLFSNNKKVVCISQSVFSEASLYFKSSKICLIENTPLHRAIDNKDISKERSLRFFCIGRIAKEKRILEFLKYLNNNKKNEKVEIIGSGEKDMIKSLDDINYSQAKVRGWLNNPYSLIGENDAIIIPSLSESFSLVLHEAVNFGIRVYIFDKTLLQNISTEDSINVILVNSFDEIYDHLKLNPPNNFLHQSNKYNSDAIKSWASRYNAL